MTKYYVWMHSLDEGEPVEIGHGPYSLEKARAFARTGSMYNDDVRITRGPGGDQVRKYSKGRRVWPIVNKQLTGFTEDEVPEHLEKDVRKPKDNKWLWTAAGVGAGVAALAAALKGVVSPPPRQVGPVQLHSNVATGPTGYRITITPEVKTLLGQALLGEVAEAASAWDSAQTREGGAAVLWSLLQLHMLWANGDGSVPHRNYPNFLDLIRGYVQPVNPLWSTAGRGKCAQYPNSCTERHLARRLRIQSYIWSTLPAQVRHLIDQWAAGAVPNPIPGLVDYAAYSYEGMQTTIAGNNFGVNTWRRLVS